jgi:hypothetical protein
MEYVSIAKDIFYGFLFLDMSSFNFLYHKRYPFTSYLQAILSYLLVSFLILLYPNLSDLSSGSNSQMDVRANHEPVSEGAERSSKPESPSLSRTKQRALKSVVEPSEAGSFEVCHRAERSGEP